MVRKIKKISKSRISSYISKEYRVFRDIIIDRIKKGALNNHRVLIILSGDNNEKISILLTDIIISYIRLFTHKKPKILYMYHDEFNDAIERRSIVGGILKKYLKKKGFEAKIEFSTYEASDRYLGTTYQVLVMDVINSLKPNDVGRLIGIVEGGGIVILLTPKWDEWHERTNLFQLSLAIPQYPEPRKIFVKWFKMITMDSRGIYIYDVDNDKIIKKDDLDYGEEYRAKNIVFPENTIFNENLYKLALTQDQVNAIKLMENLVDFPKKPLKRSTVVLIADRGRGKSCAIGIGIIGLIDKLITVKNRIRIGITAPSLLNVQSLMSLAIKALNTIGFKYNIIKREGMILEIRGNKFSIEYWEPIALIKQDLDIAVVDEAAGIPVPLLHKIWYKFKRTIFASTIHGYEGAGRGFSVRFLKRIKEDKTTNLYIYEMNEPIRYGINDPVEKWQFRVLLLDAEPDEINEKDFEFIEKKEFIYLRLNPEELFTLENEKLLRSIFGIYVLAHYRNEPDDLGMMADAPHHSIRAIKLPNGKIVAAAQLAEEGPIPNEYIDSLLRGGKIPGNIIPDRLLKHGRLRDIGNGKGWRIVRIAVHPALQGRGIGSYFLKMIEEESISRGYDWIGSGFGATEELLRFWIKNGYIPLHISPDRNPVSAEYTVLVLKPLKDPWNKIVEILNREFRNKLLESLHDTYRDLEVEVAHILLSTQYLLKDVDSCNNKMPPITPIQMDRIFSYIAGYMTYESCSDVINIMVKYYWSLDRKCRNLDKDEELLIISKTLQGHSWEYLEEIFKIRKQRLIENMRTVITKLIMKFYGLSREDIEKHMGKISLDLYRENS